MDKIENMKILPLLIASAAVLYSCDKKEASSKETTEVTAPVNDSANAADPISANAELVAQDGTTAIAANSPSDKPALNPEHGQPYHRCEIPVGAPIDSAPQQNAAPQVIPQQSASNNNFNTNPISPSLSPAAPSSSPVQATGPKPAKNPAHGEPHHRCDLEVGAPLT